MEKGRVFLVIILALSQSFKKIKSVYAKMAQQMPMCHKQSEYARQTYKVFFNLIGFVRWP